MSYTYHPMQMHLHAGHEPFSSVEGHIANAAELGMQYVWITEHDMRMGVRKYAVRAFDFSKGELMYQDAPDRKCGWETVGEPEIVFENSGMNIIAMSDKPCGVSFFTTGKRHAVSLIADVTLTVGLRHINTNGKVSVEILLSQHPRRDENGKLVHESTKLVYVLGDSSEGEIPLKDDGSGIYKLHISQDAEKYAPGGLDNAFLTARIICENGASCRFDRFEIDFKNSFQPVLDGQRRVAAELGKKYGVNPFVAFEISEAGVHKNCFSTKVPIIDYREKGYNVTGYEAILHVEKHGGIFSYNHPFEYCKKLMLSDEEKEQCICDKAEEFINTNVNGASLIEIGFTEGRAGFSLAQHLKLWDMLSLSGVFITGYGDSDSHNNSLGWFSGNNFAGWIAADASLEFPVPEEEFVKSMKAGRLYTGDPVYIKAPINFTSDGLPMGAIIPVEEEDNLPRKMNFMAEAVEDNWTMRVVVDGKTAYEEALKKGAVDYSFEVTPERPVSFARVELYNADGRCIMLTNPIYLVKKNMLSRELPKERIYAKGNL